MKDEQRVWYFSAGQNYNGNWLIRNYEMLKRINQTLSQFNSCNLWQLFFDKSVMVQIAI